MDILALNKFKIIKMSFEMKQLKLAFNIFLMSKINEF